MVAVIQELRLLKDKDPLRTKALQEDLSRRMKAFFARDRYDDLEEGEQDPEEDEDAAPADVAAESGMTPNAVYLAKADRKSVV